MPDPEEPHIDLWVSYLSDIVGHCDSDTYFVGYSLGAQAILRYLQLQLPAVRVGGAVFVAGFEKLSSLFYQRSDAVEQLRPWLYHSIHWEAVRGRSGRFTAIFSDNDPWVPLDNMKVFDEKLYAKTIVLHKRGHFNPADTPVIPEVLDEFLQL